MADAQISGTKDVVKQIVELARTSVDVHLVGNTHFVVIPNDYKVSDLSPFVDNARNPFPARKKGSASVFDANSFIEYYTLFSDANSRVFANETTNSVVAVLDYHAANDGNPRWGEHRVQLALKYSEEWKEWNGKDGVKQAQMDFAEFIEDNAPDITEPTAATMTEVARDLRAKSDVDFASAIRSQNGAVQFKYSEQIKGTYGAGNIDVPESFLISIPIYTGCSRVSVTARLRYRLNSGKLTFWFDLLRKEAIVRDAFRDMRDKIESALKITIIDGTPA